MRRSSAVGTVAGRGRADLGAPPLLLGRGTSAGRTTGSASKASRRSHRQGALVGIERRRHVDGEPEAIEQLRTQLALLRVHRPDEHEPGRVLVADALALDPVDARGGHVEQHVDEMVGEQVHLVDVEHAAVGDEQQTWLETTLPAPQRGGEVECADDPILGGAERQLGEGRFTGQERGHAAGEGGLGRALLAAQEHATDLGGDRRQHQRQLGVVVTDDGAEGEPGGRLNPNSVPRAVRRASAVPTATPTARPG